MVRKSSVKPRGNKSEPNNDLAKLEAAFAYDARHADAKKLQERADRLDPIIEWIGNMFIDVIGASREYDVYLGEAENIDSAKPGLFRKFRHRPLCIDRRNETRSEDEVKSVVTDLLASSNKALHMLELRLSDGMSVIDSVSERLKRACGVTYTVFDFTEIRRIDDGTPLKIDAEDGLITTAPTTVFPPGLKHALEGLEGYSGTRYVITRTSKEIEALSLADKVIEIKRRMESSRWHRPYYKSALEKILANLLADVELQAERKKIHDSVEVNYAAKPLTAPEKVVTARRRDIRAERIGLFFYYLFQATSSTGTRADKARVVSVLTKFSDSTIKVMLSNHLANEDKAGFEDDFKAVMKMFNLIGFSEAVELMRRDQIRE